MGGGRGGLYFLTEGVKGGPLQPAEASPLGMARGTRARATRQREVGRWCRDEFTRTRQKVVIRPSRGNLHHHCQISKGSMMTLDMFWEFGFIVHVRRECSFFTPRRFPCWDLPWKSRIHLAKGTLDSVFPLIGPQKKMNPETGLPQKVIT